MKYTLPSGNASIEKSSSILSEVDYVYPQSKKDVTQALKEALQLLHSHEMNKKNILMEGVRQALIEMGWTPPHEEVRKHDGFIVPEGATHYTEETDDEYAGFYRNRGSQRDDWECVVMGDNPSPDVWIDVSRLPYNAIKLPEKKDAWISIGEELPDQMKG